MAEVDWTEVALDSLDNIRRRIAEEGHGPQTAARVAERILAAADKLASLPARYPPTAKG